MAVLVSATLSDLEEAGKKFDLFPYPVSVTRLDLVKTRPQSDFLSN